MLNSSANLMQFARAIGTQYYPDHAGGQLPDTVAGALLALMDKLDTLINYFKAGLIPRDLMTLSLCGVKRWSRGDPSEEEVGY